MARTNKGKWWQRLPAEAKKEIYLEGRDLHIQSQPSFQKIKYALNRKNIFSIIISVGLVCIILFYAWNNWVVPTLDRIENWRNPNAEWAKVPRSYQVIPETAPNRDCLSKIEMNIADPITKKRKHLAFWIDKDGNVICPPKELGLFAVKSNRPLFDFRLQPGIGALIAPTAAKEDEEKLFDPALFLSPLQITGRVDLDAYVAPRRFGGGLSARLPFTKFSNTFIGAGVGVPYRDLAVREFVIYAKVNF